MDSVEVMRTTELHRAVKNAHRELDDGAKSFRLAWAFDTHRGLAFAGLLLGEVPRLRA
jgi:hypothetical protein